MPSIAIFFSGRIKGYTYTLHHLEEIIRVYNPTFFASLNQGAEDESTVKFCEDFNIGKDQIRYEETILPDSLSSVKYKVDGWTNVYNTYSMFFHNYKAFCLIREYQQKHNMTFDVIVKYRAEIDTSELLDFHSIQKDVLYVPSPQFDYNGLNDQIAYGDFHVMEKYCDLGNGNIEKLHYDDHVIYHPETFLLHHVRKTNIAISRPNFTYTLHDNRF